MKRLLVFLMLVIISHYSYSQNFPKYFQSSLVRVYDKLGVEYQSPFVGGIKFPVFTEFDLNGDGNKDLIILDRIDSRILTFINEGNLKFIYRPEFEKYFPKELVSFIQIHDYNGDGKSDIFTYSSNFGMGVTAFKNKSNAVDGIKFEMACPQLPSFFYGNYEFESNLPVLPVDVPAIIDCDNDGDLDILTFDELGGVWLKLYNNMSMELYGHADSFRFTCIDDYWGDFYETDLTNAVVLNTPRVSGYRVYKQPYDSIKTAWGISGIEDKGYKIPFRQDYYRKSADRHAGSTLLARDLDNDNDIDLIVGDVTYPGVQMLENGKKDNSLKYDKIIKNYMGFPSYDKPVNVQQMPSIVFLDVDLDGRDDAIFAPADMEKVDTFESLNQVWLYLNKGTDAKPVLQFKEDNFIQKDMIDLGGGTSPAFVDYDADGDMDLFVATKGNFAETFYKSDRIFYFENIGNKDTASFILKDEDFLNISSKYYRALAINFGDVDGDGDDDLLMGQENGKLIFYENTAGKGNPVSLSFNTASYKNIDAGDYSAPFIADLNGDNLNDLVIGENFGKINYFKNTGSISNPNFVLENDTFGKIFFSGGGHYMCPAVYDMDTNGFPDLLLGVQIWDNITGINHGNVYFYKDITKNLNDTFVALDSVLVDPESKQPLLKSLGIRLKPAVANLDGDNLPDILLGTERGGLSLYATNNSVYTEIKTNSPLVLCQGDSVTLDAGAGFDNYVWNTGEKTRTITVKSAKTYNCMVRKGSFTYTAYITIQSHSGTVEADYKYTPTERKVDFTLLNKDIVTHFWDFGDGSYSFDMNPTHNYVSGGKYKVCVFIKDRCGATDEKCETVTITSDIQNNQEIPEITVYPNPANNQLFVNLNNKTNGSNYNLSIKDMLGNVVILTPFKNDIQNLINIDYLKSGIYMIELIGDQNRILTRNRFMKL